MNPKPDSLLIVGTGALACLFAARFAEAGIPATLLGNWPAGVQALRDSGVHQSDVAGDERVYPVTVIDSALSQEKFTHALVLVKAWQTERAARQLSKMLAPDGVALTLQNGLGNREILARLLGAERTFLGTTTSGATLLGPGRVRSGGEGVISLAKETALQPFITWFQQTGFAVQLVSDVESIVWGKLVINAAINPLTALLDVSNGALLQLDTARVLMAAVALEIAAVAQGKGIILPFTDPVGAAEDVARKTANNISSMLQDIRRGATTEIDAICGAVVTAGKELQVSTPINETLHHLVKALSQKNKRI